MPLSPGTRLGPYEILAPLGAGGMGEVYRARDTRLDRSVAIKVLPAELSAHEEVRARFEREARAVSSLNHPHICVLHDLGRENGIDYLVLEHLEGETLAQRLERGPLSPDELLAIGIPIADALDKAHRNGLVHRDLKPANIMLTKSGAKLLDFGLARATGLGDAGAGLSRSPTMSRSLTAEGTIVGTFQYIAPEVLEGAEADERADIFAFGATVFEMATGKRAFEGKSQASVIAAILEREPPPLSVVQPMAPPALERLVKQCLVKDPEERIQSMHDVLLQLRWVQEGGSRAGVAAPAAARRRSRARLAWIMAGMATAAAVAFGIGYVSRTPPKLEPIQFQIPPPEGVFQVGAPRISPDGRYIAFQAPDSSGKATLWIRPLAAVETHAIPGADPTRRPFWSPDGRQIAFFAGTRLKKVGVEGGPSQALCDHPGGADGTWGSEGVILFDASSRDSIIRVSASGGPTSPATVIDRSRGELGHAWPQFLPDGKHFVFLAFTSRAESTWIKTGVLGSLESKPLTVGNFSRIEYAPPGYLLFTRDRALMAQPFDAGSRRFTGDPVPVASDVQAEFGGGNADFSVSSNGVLTVRGARESATGRLVWMDRAGTNLGSMGEPGPYISVELSPEGERAAVVMGSAGGTERDVWVIEGARGVASRLTTEQGADVWPVWSPDGSRVAFTSNRSGVYSIVIKRADGTGSEEFMSPRPEGCGPHQWSPDGTFLVLGHNPGATRWDISTLTLEPGAKAVPVLNGSHNEMWARISPDGKWLAYTSDESGRGEIYVRPVGSAVGKYQISTQGGFSMRWRGDSKEIFYVLGDGTMMAVDVRTEHGFQVGAPRTLFRSVPPQGFNGPQYSVTRDGERFLVLVPERNSAAPATTVVVNWTSMLRSD